MSLAFHAFFLHVKPKDVICPTQANNGRESSRKANLIPPPASELQPFCVSIEIRYPMEPRA